MMNSTVLLLLNSDDVAVDLLTYAYQWSIHNAKVVVFHHHDYHIPALTPSKSVQSLKQIKVEETKRTIESIIYSVFPKDSRLDVVISKSELSLLVNKHKWDSKTKTLVLMGLNKTGTLKEVLIGSTVYKLIERTHHIIVAIPKEVQFCHSPRFLVEVKAYSPFNAASLLSLLSYFPVTKPEVTFFTSITPKDSRSEIERHLLLIQTLFEPYANTNVAILTSESDDYSKFIPLTPMDLVVVSRGSKFIKDDVKRSFFIGEVICANKIPFAVLP